MAGKKWLSAFAGFADGLNLYSSVCVERAQRAGSEMARYDSLGSIPNQNSRLDAGFGIHVKPINSTMGDPRKKAFKFIQKQPLEIYEISRMR